jgi:hypothetical protein
MRCPRQVAVPGPHVLYLIALPMQLELHVPTQFPPPPARPQTSQHLNHVVARYTSYLAFSLPRICLFPLGSTPGRGSSSLVFSILIFNTSCSPPNPLPSASPSSSKSNASRRLLDQNNNNKNKPHTPRPSCPVLSRHPPAWLIWIASISWSFTSSICALSAHRLLCKLLSPFPAWARARSPPSHPPPQINTPRAREREQRMSLVFCSFES